MYQWNGKVPTAPRHGKGVRCYHDDTLWIYLLVAEDQTPTWQRFQTQENASVSRTPTPHPPRLKDLAIDISGICFAISREGIDPSSVILELGLEGKWFGLIRELEKKKVQFIGKKNRRWALTSATCHMAMRWLHSAQPVGAGGGGGEEGPPGPKKRPDGVRPYSEST